MFKKFIIPGLVLLVTGTAVLRWVLTEKKEEQRKAAYYKSKYGSEPDEYLKQYNEWLQLAPEQRAYLPWGLDKDGKPKTEAQLQQEQQERLIADLDKLAAGKKETYPFADILYGENWQKELNEYKKRKDLRESIFAGSLLCTFTGGAIVACCLLLWINRAIKTSSRLRKFAALFFRSQRSNKDKKLNQADAKAKIKPKAKGKVKAERKAKAEAEKLARAEEKAKAKAEAKEKAGVGTDPVKNAVASGQQERRPWPRGQVKKHSQVLINSGWQSFGADSTGQGEQALPQTLCSMKSGTGVKNSDENAEETAVLLSNEKSIELVESLEAAAENVNLSTKLEDSLKAQTENLEKQMAEFRQMTQGVQKTALEHSKPINNTLNELTQQVSAIREYAASQQDRLKKLQDGYDWNIMRTFCLRVIRCLDNLERRISQLTKQGIEVADLDEVRDELLFALESSGVEQFEPEINSDYHGQEKYAEAVKEKECCDDKNLKGKIAKLIRPGYQYFIDEENAKVVRPAQVKLFG